IYSWQEYPLLFSEVHQYGIIHRLDVPSSGLILVGKTFGGYFTLRWQQDTYDLGRHYL
ncbi:SRCAP, partial [Symbiodinium pilosum]